MNKSLILSFIGKDRPGLVSDISEIIAHHQGNWKESRLAQLAGKFAGVLLFSAPHEQINKLRESLDEYSSEELHLLLEDHDAPGESEQNHHGLLLELVGNDRSGIVHDVTEVLANLGLNVEELSTEYRDAPMSSEKLFRATIVARAPKEVALEDIQDKLEELANELMIEISEKAE